MAFEIFGFSFGRQSEGTTGSIPKPGIDSFVAPDSY